MGSVVAKTLKEHIAASLSQKHSGATTGEKERKCKNHVRKILIRGSKAYVNKGRNIPCS